MLDWPRYRDRITRTVSEQRRATAVSSMMWWDMPSMLPHVLMLQTGQQWVTSVTLVVHHNLCDLGNVPDNHYDQYNLYDLDTVPDIIESRCSGAEKCKEDYIIISNVIPTVHTASYDRFG